MDSAGSLASKASLVDSVSSAVGSYPLATSTVGAAPAEPAAAARTGKQDQHTAARLAVRVALTFVPIAAAAAAAGAVGAHSSRRGRRPGGPAGRSPSPSNRRHVSRSRFDTPREVPYTAPGPFAVAAAK